ncbi:amino acid adenylation domain-containing protein [Streptomyces cinnabarinus]|uniref:Amino acid adenylation domain-containing protein n=1 Tax=Streptomyces cinnabarinus TaxID=67287 RepID=A0ABY7KBF6_9ACTN|nr:amino acid adenylation domain-containing protein [Streptomyces cinnabarinus]WAZ21839.1 amino acid adenylation domain-containing protein [Streptomyces cinnabarinus]
MPRTDSAALLIPADSAPSAHCHALGVRLPGGTEPAALGRLLDEAARHWWPDRALPELAVRDVPFAADSDRAHRALQEELRRRPVPEGAPLGAVLLRYPDGAADLVLAAHRADLDARSLRLIAEVLDGRTAKETLAPQAAGPVAGPDTETLKRWAAADYSGRAEWATPEESAGEHTGTVVVDLDGGPADPLPALAVALGLVLGRYEGQEQPLVGVVGALPERPERALGAFDAGTLLALDLSGARSTGELVGEAGRVLDGGAGWCGRERYAELCEEAGGRPLAGVVTGAESSYLPCRSAPFPVTVAVEDGVRLVVRHRTAEVDAESAARLAGYVARVFRQLAGADLPLAEVELLGPEELASTVALGRPGRSLRWRPGRIDAAFAEQAARRPDAVALSCDGESLTYAELDARAGRFAAGLRARGTRPGERVGICLERTLDLVVTMLAVLKADAVYVPMDPAYPVERLAYTAEDAGLRTVVTTLDDFPARAGLGVVRPAELDGAEEAPAPPPRAAEEAAYVIYTSGSTGRPKGVVVPHRNVLALLAATRDDFGLGADDTWTLFHSSAFDFSVWEIWGPLLTGGRLVVVPYWVSRSPEDFRELLARERVSVLNQTPSAFAQLMEADRHGAEPLAVRLVVFGGEPLDARSLRGWLDRYPEERCRLVNMFGITETTVHVTAQTVTGREVAAGSRSVGPALPGWYLYVLDGQGRPVPVGVPGEIYVGGEGVALEYLGRPELTAERFLADPFAGGRMYRSGDRGRLLPDGRLEHLGRLDSQVKVRGFRIELDEIRNVLLDDPRVTAAAVVIGGDAAEDAAGVRIDAYVVLDGGTDTAAVRERAAGVLPSYMVPTTVTALSALPLTANGKLDARRLPEPAPPVAAPAPAGAGHDETTLAGRLAAVWESVLGVPVGGDDNFFALGGNSLHAMRVAAAMRERGMPALPIRELYLKPTVNALAAVLEGVDE